MKRKINLRDIDVKSFTTDTIKTLNAKGGIDLSKINASYCTACPPYECMA